MSGKMRTRIFISTSGRHLTRAAKEEDGTWAVDFLLEGQDIRCLAADPLDSSRVFAGRQEGGVLVSNNQGLTWQEAGLPEVSIKSLAVSKIEGNHLYAGTKSPPRIYHSKDSGMSWQELESFRKTRKWFWFSPAESTFAPYVQSIALSPTDPKVMMVGIELGAVLRSADGGESWSGHLKGSLRDCHTMAFHETDGNWVYEAGGSGGGAAVSKDGGKSWQQEKKNLDRSYGWSCVGDGVDPQTWYVSASSQAKFPNFVPQAHVDGKANASIYRRRGGEPWERLTGGLPDPLNNMAYSLKTDPQESGHLYAGLSSGDVWFTSDSGDSWQQVPVNLGGIHRDMVVIL